jgi:hypothetical protein
MDEKMKKLVAPARFFGRKIEMFFSHLSNLNELNIHIHPMVDPEHPARVPAPAPVPVPVPVPVPAPVPEHNVRPANVWDDYERITDELNRSPQVQERYTNRIRMINNTAGYRTGNQTLHIRSIQMYNWDDWNALFGTEQLDPNLRVYAEAAIEYAQDETGTIPYAGQMEVSLIMQENYRYGIHRAILMVHVTPHRRFYDGHIIQKEFSEGSHTHQTINRLFDTNIRAVVLQATQYQFLEYLADDDETLEVMNDYFMDPDFTSIRFSYVPDPGNEIGGHYVADPNALDDEHRLHYCAEEDHHHHHHHAAAPVVVEPVIAIPPPPPVYDIGEIYQRNIEMYYAPEEDEYGNHVIYNEEPRYDNIIRIYNDEPRHPIQG